MKKLPDLIKDDFSLKRESKNIYTIWKTKKNWVFRLGPDGRAAKVSTETGKDEEPPVIFRLRSVDSMIYFLGEIVRLQLRNHQLPQIRVGEREALSVLFRLHIDAGRDLGDRVEVGFLGKRFAIARKGDDAEDERTLTVFALVSQLFSLYRESTDLPKTSAVQIIGSQ